MLTQFPAYYQLFPEKTVGRLAVWTGNSGIASISVSGDMAEPQPQKMEAARLAVLDAYRRHAAELTRIAMLSTRNQSLAQDVLQETFLRYFMTRMHHEPIHDERGWLCHVMRTVIADWKKSDAAADQVSLEDAEAVASTEAEGLGVMPRPWTLQIARILAPRERQCIHLRAQGLEYKEIASAMDIDIGTVGTLLNRAIRKLRQVLRVREELA